MSQQRPSVGDKLNERRRFLGQSREEAGAECGVAGVTYGQWELDQSAPTRLENILAVAKYLGIDPMKMPELLGETQARMSEVRIFAALRNGRQEP